MYKIVMRKTHTTSSFWYWAIFGTNGKYILKCPKYYTNRTQCRNVMMEFSRKFKIPYNETEVPFNV